MILLTLERNNGFARNQSVDDVFAKLHRSPTRGTDVLPKRIFKPENAGMFATGAIPCPADDDRRIEPAVRLDSRPGLNRLVLVDQRIEVEALVEGEGWGVTDTGNAHDCSMRRGAAVAQLRHGLC